MASHKLDIFDVLSAVDKHDYDFLDQQSEESRKSFAPPVVLRWASAVRGDFADYMLMLVNQRANLDFYDLTAYPDLQYRLIASCGLGVRPRHEWIAMPARAKSRSGVHKFLSEQFPEANGQELDLLLGQFTRDSFIEFLHECGLSPADEKTTLTAYDQFTGHAPKKKAKSKR